MESLIMNIELYVQIATLLAVILAAGGLIFGIFAYQRQMNAQLFLEYTNRYEQILSGFPEDALKWRLDSNLELPMESPELSYAILRYLNLCSEEFYLHKSKYLSSKIWMIWEDELIKTIGSPLYRREWPKLKEEFSSYLKFQQYVDSIQRTT